MATQFPSTSFETRAARQTRWPMRKETIDPPKLSVNMPPTIRQSGPHLRHCIWPQPRSGAAIFSLRLWSIRASSLSL